ncbi:MAG: DUF4292 domain-containing protein [Ferruginibacter sp.]
MKYIIALALLISAGAISCRSSRHTSKNINKGILPRDTSTIMVNQSSADSIALMKTTFDQLDKNYINFKTFSAKIKVEIEDAKGKQPDITATLRMIKDSVIWMSLSATFLNIEVFRVLITKDSVVLLNKQNKEVQYRSLGYLQEVTEIPFDFNTLQNMLIGNPIFFNRDQASIRKIENFILLSSLGKEFKNTLTLTASNNFLLHSKLDDINISRKRTAELMYDDYAKDGNNNFSTSRQITVTEMKIKKLDVSMNIKQFEFNKELSLPFSVPKNYKKK